MHVGFLDVLTMRRYERAITAAADPSSYPIASPWSSSNLERIVADDIFGSDRPENTRAAAMRIPSVARGRNLIVSTISRMMLVALRRGDQLPTQPSWITSSTDGTSPEARMVWTVDDLMFYGWSCWWRTNRQDGFPLDVGRVPIGSWSINADNRVEINGIVQADNAVILIPGWHEGILTFGRDTIDDARSLYRNVRNRLSTPIPGLDLHQTGGRQLTDDEIDALIDRWAVARRGNNAGVSYTSEHIDAKPMSSDDAELMIEARNAAAVDLARLIGVSAGLIDATAPKASLNYETTAGRNLEFVDRDVALYMSPIEARLSMDDITPKGTRIAFDTSAFTAPIPSPTGAPRED